MGKVVITGGAGFFGNLLAGMPPVIFGDGEQSRDFTFAKDVVNANIPAAESQASGIINIGSSTVVTINQLAQMIIKLVGKSNIRPVHEVPRPGDIVHSLADIAKAKSFGYYPEYTA